MPKFKGRTTSCGEWSEENMKRAIQDVLDHKMSERMAAERYKVPRTSLQDHVKAAKQGQQIILKPILGRFQHLLLNMKGNCVSMLLTLIIVSCL
jgi:hypothetical protein